MTHTMMLLACVLLAMVAAVAPAPGQVDDETSRTSLGLRFGYALSSGDWNEVRSAPGVRLMKTGIAFGADFEIPLSARLSLAIDAGYEPLDGGDWEAYARSRGDEIRVSAAFAYAGVLLRPYFLAGSRDRVWCEFGPALLFPGGEERFEGALYSYDFFGTIKVGGEGALAYERMLGENMAASLRCGGLLVPSGVSYADGESRALLAFPVTLGVRFFF